MESSGQQPVAHYYGDIIRLIFIVAGVVVLLGLPVMTGVLGIPLFIAVLGVVILGVAAGLTNPRQRGPLLLNIAVSVAGLLAFVSMSWVMHGRGVAGVLVFLNQLLAAFFLIALYLSVKSLCGYDQRGA